MNKQEYILELINKGYSDDEIELLVKDKFPEEEIIPFMPAPDSASSSQTNITPQEAFNETWDILKNVGEKAVRHGVTNITDLATGDAIYNYVEQGKIYFMAVDHNKQYLMQGLCINKDSSQATFVGYSWNTSVKHTNTVWAQARKGSTSGDTLSFNGVSVDDLKNDDNAIANVALVKSLVAAGGGSGGSVDTTNLALKDLSNVDNTILRKKVESLSAYGIVTTSDCKTEVELYNKLNSLGGGESKSIRILLHIDEDWKYTITNDDGTTNYLTLYSNFYIAEFYTQTQDSTYRSVNLSCKFLDSINDKIYFSAYGAGDSNGSTDSTKPKFRSLSFSYDSDRMLNTSYYRIYPENEIDSFNIIQDGFGLNEKIGETYVISLFKDYGDATPEQEIMRKTFGVLTLYKIDYNNLGGQDVKTKFYLYGKLIGYDGSVKNIKATVSYDSTNEYNFTYLDEPTFTISDIESWTPDIVDKIKQKLGLSTTPQQTLQEYIDTLDWTNVTLTVQDVAGLITPDMFIGLPNLDSDITTTISDHENITGAGHYDFVLEFNSQGETATKTVSVNVTIGTAPNDLAQTIEGLTWTGITYTTDATVAEDSLGMLDLINAPQIPDDVTIDSITHSSISASGDLTVSIHFSKGSQTYIKNIVITVTINSDGSGGSGGSGGGGTTLQEQIDSLSWTSLTIHIPTSSLLENQLTINDFVSFPNLPSGTLVKSITHHALTSGDNLDATINFSRGSESASKNINIQILDSMYFPNTYKIQSSDYNSITYSKSSSGLANNDTITLNNSTFVDKIRLSDNVEIQFATSGTIRLSDNSKFLTIKYNDGNQYNYAFPNNVTPTYDFVAGHNYQIHSGSLISDLGAYGTRSITITESDYTSIDDDGTGPRFVGYTLRDTSTVFNEMIAYIKTNKTIHNSVTFYDDGYNTVYSGTISSATFDLVAGKTYKFVNGFDPVEVTT